MSHAKLYKIFLVKSTIYSESSSILLNTVHGIDHNIGYIIVTNITILVTFRCVAVTDAASESFH